MQFQMLYYLHVHISFTLFCHMTFETDNNELKEVRWPVYRKVEEISPVNVFVFIHDLKELYNFRTTS